MSPLHIWRRIHETVKRYAPTSIIKRLFRPRKPRKPYIHLPPHREWQGEQYGLCAVAIMWNEGPDLQEWIEFQRLVGIQHVYLYDDGSTDNSSEIVSSYIETGYVTLVPWAAFFAGFAQQRLAYAHALCTFGPRWRWMAFIDIDEFLFPVREESLLDVLERYEDIPAIVVPWHMFGFCGHQTRPRGLVIENYTRRVSFPPQPGKTCLLNWKSIVNPRSVTGVDSPHFFFFQHGRRGGFTEAREWVDESAPPNWTRLESGIFRLNHYFTKSYGEFTRKRMHGRSVSGRGADAHVRRALRYANAIESSPTVEDHLILRFVPRLHIALSGRLDQSKDDRDPVEPGL